MSKSIFSYSLPTVYGFLAQGLLCAAMVFGPGKAGAVERVPILFNVPEGLQNYSGQQPVTFGIPFSKGQLKAADGLRVVDAQGKPVASQFEITAYWLPEKDSVRWLLVDCFAAVQKGKAENLFLEFGPDVKTGSQKTSLAVKQDGGQITVDTGAGTWVFNREGGSLGNFTMNIDFGNGLRNTYTAGGGNGDFKIEVEKDGPVRAVIKLTGSYGKTDGKWAKNGVPGIPVAEFVTRIRLYAGCPFARVYHSMIWMTNDGVRIGDLKFQPVTAMTDFAARAGLDGAIVTPDAEGKILLRQDDWNKASGTASGKHLDGWIEAVNSKESFFAGLRWAWQQYPVAFSATPKTLDVDLIGPAEPMSLKMMDVIHPPLKNTVPGQWEIVTYKGGIPFEDVANWHEEAIPFVSPRGVSKTWELLLWRGKSAEKTSAETKNIFAQHPVYGYADPKFATKAALPSPSSPYDPQAFPEVEGALKRAFDFYTREVGEDGDYGIWNYGDLQWCWTPSGYPAYRYWMGNGKAWSVLPWILWLRSGDRDYLENGEANSRHIMDVDTCHTHDTDWNPLDGKIRGGQYCFSAFHWGRGPTFFEVFADTEWMPYSYYLTGYERAKDVMLMEAEAIANYKYRKPYIEHVAKDPENQVSRHVYVAVKNVAALYEATGDERLKEFAEEWLNLSLSGQLESGEFVGITTNMYLDQSLNIAARIFGWDRVEKALQKWNAFQGDPLQVSDSGSLTGPNSLWTNTSLVEHGADKRLLDVAARVMNTQAVCVVEGDPRWSGLSMIAGNEAGHTLRDWVITMASLSKLPLADRPTGFIPMSGFNSRLEVTPEDVKEGMNSRHLVLALKEKEAVTIRAFYLFLRPAYRYKVTGPDGVEILKQQGEFKKGEPAAITFTIPAEAKPGVYAIEIWSKSDPGMHPPIHTTSSGGKVVNYILPGDRTIYSNHAAGQFWFVPEGKGIEVLFANFQNHSFVSRNLLLDPAGKVVATNKIEGTTPAPFPAPGSGSITSGFPKGSPCVFTPQAIEPGLYSFVVSSQPNWPHAQKTQGMKPFISGTREEWFDPAAYPCPNLAGYK